MGSNPGLTFPAVQTQLDVYKKLDFLAVCDLFMTATARQADLVLPAADFLNNLEIHDYGRVGKPCLGLVRPISHEAPGWPVWKWVFKLAHGLGLKEFFPWEDNETALKHRLEGTQVSLEDLKASPTSVVSYTPAVIETAHRKVHYFSAEAETAAKMGLTTVDSLKLPFTTDETFPLWLSSGDRVPTYQHSQFKVSESYRKSDPEPFVDIHSETAENLGIQDGDRVQVTTRWGELQHGWDEANVNQLTGLDYLDSLSGFPWCRALPARVTFVSR